MVDSRREMLDEIVQSGWLTPEEADQLAQSAPDGDAFVDAIWNAVAKRLPEVGERVRMALGLDRRSFDRSDGEANADPSSPVRETTDIPEIVGGRYRIVCQIAQGGMGTVYEALDLTLNRRVAIKFPKDGRIDKSLRERLERERQILTDLDEPDLVTVFDAGTLDSGQPYFVMRYIEGTDLATYVHHHSIRTRGIAELVAQVARAVGTAHRRTVVHRDLKPSNILVTPEGRPVVIDFGLAKWAQNSSEGDESRRLAGQTTSTRLGTEGYIAPEQADGGLVTSATDVYSLGVVLHELLSGDKPSPTMGREHNQLQIDRQVPVELRAIIAKCLDRDPMKRYFTGYDLAEDLQRYLDNKPVAAVTAGRNRYIVSKFLWRHRVALACVLLLTAFSVAGLLVAFRRAQKERDLAIAASIREHDLRERRDYEILRQNLRSARNYLADGKKIDAEAVIREIPKSVWSWDCERLLYESQQGFAPTATIGAHDWGVADLLYTPAGEVLSAGQDGRIIAWSASGNDPRELCAGSWSESSRLWQHAFLKIPDDDDSSPLEPWSSLSYLQAEGQLLAASLSGRLLSISVSSGAVKTILRHAHPITAMATSSNDALIGLGDDAGDLIVLDADAKQVDTLSLQSGTVTDVASLPTGEWCAATENGTLFIVSSGRSGQVTNRLSLPGPLWSVDVSRDGLIAVAASQPKVQVIQYQPETNDLVPLRDFQLPSDERSKSIAPQAVRWASDGSRLAAGDDLGRLLVWNFATGETELVGEDQTERLLKGEMLNRLPITLQRRCSSIAFEETPDALWTGGHDTSIKRWDLKIDDGVTTVRVPPKPVLTSDKSGDLWVGTSDGMLSLWDVESHRSRSSVLAHSAPIIAISLATATKLLATTDGSSVRFWSRGRDVIATAYQEIASGESILSLDLAPQGDRLAIYLEGNKVQLWEARDSRLVVQVDLGPGHAVSGKLDFNSTGERIAVAGPEQTCWILDGHTLQMLDRPYVYSGSGGTDIQWSPLDPNRFCGGNANGRVQTYPEKRLFQNTTKQFRDMPVVDVEWTPDGRRFAACSADGEVAIVEPNVWGPLHVFHSLRAPNARLTGLAFDPRGGDLILANEDGILEFWKLALPLADVKPPTTTWHVTDLEAAGRPLILRSREPAIAVGPQGELLLAYVRSSIRSTDDRFDCSVRLGLSTKDRFVQRVLHEMGPLDNRRYMDVVRSLALAVDDQTVWATYRQPRFDIGTTTGELVLCHARTDEFRSADDLIAKQTASDMVDRETVPPPGNHGFDVNLFAIPGNAPDILHFSHAGHYHLWTRWDHNQWETTRLGRQGDGFRAVAARADDGVVHAAFRPTRFNGDPLPPIHVAYALHQQLEPASRPPLSLIAYDQPRSIALNPAGEPILLLHNTRALRGNELLLVRLRDDAPTTLARIPFDVAREDVSNLVVDRRGISHLAIVNAETKSLMLASVDHSGCRRQHIASLEGIESDNRVVTWFGPFLQIDDAGRIFIVLGHNSLLSGWLRTWHADLP